ncbi:uncharacterized protein DS421_14g473890 [Arachis hypogaea]|nr:uncharacterized protein DS421_14g473890 [Arachis hypogaea]
MVTSVKILAKSTMDGMQLDLAMISTVFANTLVSIFSPIFITFPLSINVCFNFQ